MYLLEISNQIYTSTIFSPSAKNVQNSVFQPVVRVPLVGEGSSSDTSHYLGIVIFSLFSFEDVSLINKLP